MIKAAASICAQLFLEYMSGSNSLGFAVHFDIIICGQLQKVIYIYHLETLSGKRSWNCDIFRLRFISPILII